jgi:hypothetical protein
MTGCQVYKGLRVRVTFLQRGIQKEKKVVGEGKQSEEGTMDEKTEQRWREVSEEVLSGRKEWRQAHPKATFREIEQAVQERLSRLEAQMLQDGALESEQRDWKANTEEAPRCSVCETQLSKRGT